MTVADLFKPMDPAFAERVRASIGNTRVWWLDEPIGVPLFPTADASSRPAIDSDEWWSMFGKALRRQRRNWLRASARARKARRGWR